MSTATKSFPVVDADSHIIEPRAIWDEYLEPEYRVAGRAALFRDENAVGSCVVLNGKAVNDTVGAITRSAVWKPGMTTEQLGALDPRKRHPINPGAWDAAARLKDLDALGIDHQLLVPSLIAEYFPLVENPELAGALARAYNNWILDFCKKEPKRLLPAAVIPTQFVDQAIAELQRAARLGFRFAFIRPAFVNDHFLHHPYYDPMWKEMEGLGLMACFHPSPGEHNPDFTSHGHFMGKVAKYAGLAHPLAPIVASLMDNAVLMTSFFYYGHLERFPRLKLGFFHSGASWLYIVLEKSEGYLALPFFPRDYPVREDPDHLFYERKCLITFDADDTPLFRMPDSFADVAVFSTRYPNQDTTTPQEVIAGLKSAGISTDVTRKLMGGNLLSAAGLPAAARKSK